jgi:hypothetical protein
VAGWFQTGVLWSKIGGMRVIASSLPILLAACAVSASAPMGGRVSELDGRVAGAAQRCVPIERDLAMRVDERDHGTLLYGYGRKIWANHLPPGCSFSPSDTLVVQPIGSDYCRGDFVRTVDPVSHFPGASCILGDFVPYTLPK